MNLVIADTEEFRRIKKKQNKPAAPGAVSSSAQTIEQEEKRTLGLTIVRGAHIVSLSVESPPPADPSARLGKTSGGGIASTLSAGPGVARPAGRGAAPPMSLAVSYSAILGVVPMLTCHQGPAAGVGAGAPPAGFPGFPGAPGFGGRGGRKYNYQDLTVMNANIILAGAPPGFPGGFPPAGFPPGPGGQFPPPGFPAGAPPPAGFNPPPRR